MKKYLIDNAHWIFEGVGALFLVGILGGASRYFMNRKTEDQNSNLGGVRSQTISTGHSSTNIQTGDASTVHVTTNHPAMSEEQNINPIKIDNDGAIRHKVIILEGNYQEFIWRGRTIRVSVYETVKNEFQFSSIGKKEGIGAVVDFDTGGGLVYGGEYCKKIDVNKFLIPLKKSSDEEPSSVFTYHVFGNSFSFMRVFVDHINQLNHRVTLDLFFADIPIKPSVK